MPNKRRVTPTSNNRRPPIILALGDLDPSGGSGIQADIETAASLGCHCAPVATSLSTTADPEARASVAVSSTLVIEQARSILESMAVAAIKVGFTGSVANIESIHSILRDYPHIPVSLHPALGLVDEDDVEHSGMVDALVELLIPEATTVNMSLSDLHQLAPEADTVDASAQAIISRGCHYLLVCNTGQREQGYRNSLYRSQGLIRHYQWEQTSASCHGAAGTLASSIAAYLGHNSHPTAAVEQGQNYTWQALVAARQLGAGRATPHRFFWADDSATTAGEPPAETGTH